MGVTERSCINFNNIIEVNKLTNMVLSNQLINFIKKVKCYEKLSSKF
jgi:hypothetical protein